MSYSSSGAPPMGGIGLGQQYGGMPQAAGPAGLGGGAGMMGPNVQGVLQQFQGMSPEQLHELSARMGEGSPYSQLAGVVANQKQMMPNAGGGSGGFNSVPGQAGLAGAGPGSQWRNKPQDGPSISIEGGGGGNSGQGGANSAGDGSADANSGGMYRKGGALPKYDAGGISASQGSPWWSRAADRGQTSGLLNSDIGGRTDHIPANPIVGSYVIPADVVSGLGEGNTLAGARVLDAMMHSGPYGTTLPRVEGATSRYSQMPAPPPMMGQERAIQTRGETVARGGSTPQQGTVKCLMAGGEYVVAPQDAARLGGGDVKKGHQVLDKFVKRVRHKTISEMGGLKPPVGSSQR